MSERITVVGSLNMDLVVRSPRIPQPGETIIGHEWHTIPGGKGANQAVAAARLGGQVSMVGRVGKDGFAQALLENLTESSVDHKHVSQDPESATGVALITVDDAGENTIVVASGANMKLSPQEVEAVEETIASSKVLLLQLESPLETVTRAAQLARAHGVTVVLNPAPARQLPAELLSLVDVLVPNESETALLTGMPIDSQGALESAAGALLKKGISNIILTLGAMGAMLANASGFVPVPAFKIDPVDTTAAGDAFVGAVGVSLAEAKPITEAVRWGNAAGALAATKLGAQTSLPSRENVEALSEIGDSYLPGV